MPTAQERLAEIQSQQQLTAQQRLAEIGGQQAPKVTEDQTFGGSNLMPKFTTGVDPEVRGDPALPIVTGALTALVDATAGVANAALAEIAGGSAGAIAALYGGSNDKAVEAIEVVSDFLTVFPITEGGKGFLAEIGPTLMHIETGADRLSERLGMGNPIAQTAIKTILLGGTELLPAAGGVKDAAKAGAAMRRRERKIKKIAEDKGINLDLKNFSDDLADAAHRLTPDERAQNAPLLVESLRDAKQRDLDAKDAKFDAAKASRTYVETGSIKDLSEHIFRELVEDGTDFKEMPAVLSILEDMDSIETRIPGVPGKKGIRPLRVNAVNLNQLEILRRRTNSVYEKGTPGSTKMGAVRREIDNFTNSELDKAIINEGRIVRGEGAIYGDAYGKQMWDDARLANKRYKDNFSADRTISDLIEKEATPEQYSRWLMGASSVNAKPQAALTIRRIKKVLGDDSPAVEGIRQDFLFEMYEPLLREDPNFSQFTRNYDTMVRRNPSLVKELGLDQGAMKDMHDFAKVQSRLPPSGRVFTKGDIVAGVTRMAVGHQIAKAAVRVEFSRRLANAVAGVDAVTPKQIIGDIMDIKFDAPMIPKKSTLAAEFITGAALSSMEGENE